MLGYEQDGFEVCDKVDEISTRPDVSKWENVVNSFIVSTAKIIVKDYGNKGEAARAQAGLSSYIKKHGIKLNANKRGTKLFISKEY